MPSKRPNRLNVGDVVRVRLYPSGEIVEAEVKAIAETTLVRKLQVSFDVRTAPISVDQIVKD